MSWRTPVTLLVLLAFITGAGWYGWQQFTAPMDNEDERLSCVEKRLAKGSRLTPTQVTINVYNAGSREGLAGQTLDRLRRLDFRPGIAENAPSRIRVDGVAIYDSAPRSTAVRLVRAQFAGRVRVAARPDIAPGIDVVVGSDFKGTKPSAVRSVRLPRPEKVCVPGRRSARR